MEKLDTVSIYSSFVAWQLFSCKPSVFLFCELLNVCPLQRTEHLQLWR